MKRLAEGLKYLAWNGLGVIGGQLEQNENSDRSSRLN